jgi:hypothetical protein
MSAKATDHATVSVVADDPPRSDPLSAGRRCASLGTPVGVAAAVGSADWPREGAPIVQSGGAPVREAGVGSKRTQPLPLK